MTRLRVTDRSTGETIAEVDPAHMPAAAGPLEERNPPPAPATPAERPVVLAGDTLPMARGRLPVEVVVAGWRFELEVEDGRVAELRARATTGGAAAIHHGPTEVRAIIPGRVVSVAVTTGDAVTAGQRLLAVEAMKMENELRAPRDGTVERVAVAVGETVDVGDPLVVLR